ncbi:hypothetical protein DL768_004888 [Monosporascus sp. mg162]|nr:hypothetical protein DL768_004888 [Monosporascus sp. mg162]
MAESSTQGFSESHYTNPSESSREHQRNPAGPTSRRPDYMGERPDNLMLLPTLERKLMVDSKLSPACSEPEMLASAVFAERTPEERKVLAQAVTRKRARIANQGLTKLEITEML